MRPFFLSVKTLTSKSQEFFGKERPYNQYDPELGWSVRPNSQSENGLYASNAAGVRVAKVGQEITSEAPPGIFRIAILGDSFTHSDDVPFEVSWGAILEMGSKPRFSISEGRDTEWTRRFFDGRKMGSL